MNKQPEPVFSFGFKAILGAIESEFTRCGICGNDLKSARNKTNVVCDVCIVCDQNVIEAIEQVKAEMRKGIKKTIPGELERC